MAVVILRVTIKEVFDSTIRMTTISLGYLDTRSERHTDLVMRSSDEQLKMSRTPPLHESSYKGGRKQRHRFA